MPRIESYLLRQLFWPTLLAVGALLAVAVLSQTLSTLSIVVSHGQSLGVFLKVLLLGLPGTAVVVLPVAVFVAALVTLNRLHTEHEIVVCFAGGMSRWRVAAPALRLAAGAALLTLVVNLWVAPWCARQVRTELYRVRTDLASTLVREGRFAEPSPGLTVYAQSADGAGGLRNVFIHQQREGRRASAYSAARGIVTRQGDRPVLVLRDGSNEEFSDRDVLNHLAFEEYVFDLTPFLRTDEALVFKISDRFLHELVFPDPRGAWEARNAKKMLAEAHSRLASPLYCLTLMLIALNAVFGGPFSRIGYARRMASACFAAVAVRIAGFGVQAASDGAVALNVLQYLAPLAPAAWIAWRLFLRDRDLVRRFAPLTPALGAPA